MRRTGSSKGRRTALGGILACLLLSGCGEQLDTKFADYRHVRESGYLATGWIPDCLPEGTYNFLERHDLDTNEVWVFFRFREEADEELRNALSERRDSEWKFLLRRSKPPFWWAQFLPRRVKYYTYAPKPPCRKYYQAAFLAVDWEGRYAYFKSP